MMPHSSWALYLRGFKEIPYYHTHKGAYGSGIWWWSLLVQSPATRKTVPSWRRRLLKCFAGRRAVPRRSNSCLAALSSHPRSSTPSSPSLSAASSLSASISSWCGTVFRSSSWTCHTLGLLLPPQVRCAAASGRASALGGRRLRDPPAIVTIGVVRRCFLHVTTSAEVPIWQSTYAHSCASHTCKLHIFIKVLSARAHLNTVNAVS